MEGVVRLRSAFVNPSKDGPDPDPAEEKERERTQLADGILRKKSFYFQQRTGKLDMRSIGRVDISAVVRDVDVDTLQAHLENVTFCNLTEDDLRIYSDDCFLRLFQLAQLALEYLLHVQDTLAAGLETLAAKHNQLASELGQGRAQYRALHDAARRLKREVRQKRRTIQKYEQLLSVAPLRGTRVEEEHHTCLACGKLFTSDAFLQQHITRKHGSQQVERVGDDAEAEEKRRAAEEAARFPAQLELYVQLPSGQCLELSVLREASGRQLKDYVNASAGSAVVGGGKKLVFRGVHVQDDRSLLEQRIPTGSTLLIIDTEVAVPLTLSAAPEDSASAAAAAAAAAAAVASDSNASSSRQLATLVGLMQQQLQWSMQRDESRTAQTLDASAALERRMRELEASLPKRLEGLLGGELSGLTDALQAALRDARGLAARGSNAGDLLDDDDGKQTAELAKKVQQYERELSELRASGAASNTSNAATGTAQQRRSSTQTSKEDEGPWLLAFEAEGARPHLEVQVEPHMTSQIISEQLAVLMDVDPARICLRDVSRGVVLPPDETAASIRRMRRGGGLVLEALDPQDLLTDEQVDALVDIYDQTVPREARRSRAVQSSLAEMERVARSRSPRFQPAGRGGSGNGNGRRGSTDSVFGDLSGVPDEEQVAATRRELTGALAATFARADGAGGSSGFLGGMTRFDGTASAFPNDHPLSPEGLGRTLENRRALRPKGVERRMEQVRAAADEALARAHGLIDDRGETDYNAYNAHVSSSTRTNNNKTTSKNEVNRSGTGMAGFRAEGGGRSGSGSGGAKTGSSKRESARKKGSGGREKSASKKHWSQFGQKTTTSKSAANDAESDSENEDGAGQPNAAGMSSDEDAGSAEVDREEGPSSGEEEARLQQYLRGTRRSADNSGHEKGSPAVFSQAATERADQTERQQRGSYAEKGAAAEARGAGGSVEFSQQRGGELPAHAASAAAAASGQRKPSSANVYGGLKRSSSSGGGGGGAPADPFSASAPEAGFAEGAKGPSSRRGSRSTTDNPTSSNTAAAAAAAATAAEAAGTSAGALRALEDSDVSEEDDSEEDGKEAGAGDFTSKNVTGSSSEAVQASGDWNRTAETNVSVPEDAISRADEHERAAVTPF